MTSLIPRSEGEAIRADERGKVCAILKEKQRRMYKEGTSGLAGRTVAECIDLIPPPPKQTKMGRPPKPGEAMQIVGHFSDVAAGRAAMGIDWMTAKELAQAIPPAYTEFIGRQLLDALSNVSHATPKGDQE